MPKGLYAVEGESKGARADTSYRACVAALLVFLLFCVTIIIVLAVVKRSDAGGGAGGGKAEAAERSGSEADADRTETTTAPTERAGTSKKGAHRPSVPPPTSSPATTTTTNSTTTTTTTTLATPAAPGERSELRSAGEPRDTEAEPTTTSAPPGSSAATSAAPAAELPLAPPPTPAPTSPPPPEPVACESAACKEAAAALLGAMGHGARPCDHAYELACGGLRRSRQLLEPDYEADALARIVENIGEIGDSSPESFKKFKILEESCRKYDVLRDKEMWRKAVIEEMAEIGSFVPDDSSFTANFTHLFLALLQHDRPLIFDITLDVNDKMTNTFAIKIVPAQLEPDPMFPEESELMECQAQAARKYKNLNDIYQDTLKCMESGEGRQNVLATAREALRILNILSEEKLNETLAAYADFLDIDAMRSKATQRLEQQRRDPELKAPSELGTLFLDLHVDWAAIIEALINRPLKEGETIQVYSSSYFRKINEKFKASPRRLHNGLLAAFAATRFGALVEAQQRWRRALQPLLCARAAAQLLPDAAAALYLRAFPAPLRAQLEQGASDLLYELVNAAFREVARADWLRDFRSLADNVTFKLSHLRLRNASDTPELQDAERLDRALQPYILNETDFVRNAIKLMARNRRLLYERIDKDPSNCIWTHFIAPYDTNAISIYSLNVIAVPLGAMQRPLFHPDFPPHVRMAGLGFSIAHELAHHLDKIGIRYHTTINEFEMKEYLLNLPGFNNFKHDVRVEYLNETGPHKYAHLNFTLLDAEVELKNNELMADKMGIKIAFEAFNRTNARAKRPVKLPFLTLTNDQSFFVFLAQKFCSKMDFFSSIVDFFESPSFPPETRVEQMMDNFDFYKAFNCSSPASDLQFPYSEFTVPESPPGA